MDYSLADIRSVVDGDRDGGFLGESGFLWVILIFLFFLAFSGGDGLFGNRNNGMSQVERDVLTTSCGTQKEVLQNRYDNALQTQTLSAQMAQCCCDLRAEGLANTQSIINLIQQDKIEQLREQVNSTNLALNNVNLANEIISAVRPTPIPAYITCSPYTSAYYGNCCGCGNNLV